MKAAIIEQQGAVENLVYRDWPDPEIAWTTRRQEALAVRRLVESAFPDPAGAEWLILGDLNDYVDPGKEKESGIAELVGWEEVWCPLCDSTAGGNDDQTQIKRRKDMSTIESRIVRYGELKRPLQGACIAYGEDIRSVFPAGP